MRERRSVWVNTGREGVSDSSLSRRGRAAIAAAVFVVAALIAAAPASAALAPLYSTSGAVTLSQNGYGSNSGALTKPIVKPSAGATVQKAFLFAAGTPGYTPANGDITLASQPVVFSDTPVTASFSEITRETDVTSIVKPIIDAAPAGNVDQTVEEVNNSGSIDGEALV